MIKRTIALLALCFTVAISAKAQEVLSGYFHFQRQSQIDSFPIMYPECHHIDGWVSIVGDSITNLMGLSNIDTVQCLEISYCPALIKLKGLDSLEVITEWISLENLKNLQSISSLLGLKSVKSFYLTALPRLRSLYGLGNIESINVLEIFGELGNGFNNLKGLDRLRSLEQLKFNGLCQEFSTEGLNDIQKLALLSIVGCSERIDIAKNSSLDSLGQLDFSDNDGIDSLIGIGSVDYIGFLSVRRNKGLRSISGFDSLISAGIINILSNEELICVNSFDSLKSLESFSFLGNTAIDSLCVFPALESLNMLNVSGNSSLNYIQGVNNTRKINELLLSDNERLEKVEIFGKLDTIIQQKEFAGLIIKQNPMLRDVEFLSSLKYCESSLEIKGCNSLIELNPLNSIEYMSFMVGISSNENLETLPDWNNINLDNNFRMIITDNPKLNNCKYEWLCSYIDRGHPATIKRNSGDCETLDLVKAACDITSTNELAISDISISISGKNIHVVSGKGQELKEIRLIALSGKEVFSKNCSGNFESIHYGSYPAGLYVLCVETNNKSVHKKLVLH